MEVILQKTFKGFMPADPKSEEWASKIKIGDTVHGNFKKFRNVGFHRKYFALLNIAFDHWQPGEINSKYGTPEKNFERFRKDLAILAGFYDVVIRLDGSTRVEAQSISFANMDQDTFEKLYSKTIDVLLKQVYNASMTREEIDKLVDQYIAFA